MSFSAERNFFEQQGFRDAAADSCGFIFPALMFQPKVIGILVVIGLILQNWLFFVILSAVLWWNVLVPDLNPFDALYNRLIGARCPDLRQILPGVLCIPCSSA